MRRASQDLLCGGVVLKEVAFAEMVLMYAPSRLQDAQDACTAACR
jgi:hypothetical protein